VDPVQLLAQPVEDLCIAGLAVEDLARDLDQRAFQRLQYLSVARVRPILFDLSQPIGFAGLFGAQPLQNPVYPRGAGALLALHQVEAAQQMGHRLVDAADRFASALLGRLDPGRQPLEGVAYAEGVVDGTGIGFIAPGRRYGVAAGGRVARGVFQRSLILEDHLIEPFAKRHA
jgi:hypothetical protein